jgi:glucan phosphoethanolaminetransferase (alkaline phosphatase superfamily)
MAMKKLVTSIMNINIYILSIVPIILGLIIILFGSNWAAQCNRPCNDLRFSVVLILGLLTISLTGIVQIYRREAPGLGPNYPFRGWLAVVQGVLMIVLCWGMMIYLIYSIIVDIFLA